MAWLLDTAVACDDLSAIHLEGMVFLAFAFQHGVRPVECITLEVGHIRLIRDAAGNQQAIVSFHRAKQALQSPSVEKPRAIKLEWVPLVVKLYQQAIEAGRTRLFEAKSTTNLSARTRWAAKRFGVTLTNHGIYRFRHTAAQALAGRSSSRH